MEQFYVKITKKCFVCIVVVITLAVYISARLGIEQGRKINSAKYRVETLLKELQTEEDIKKEIQKPKKKEKKSKWRTYYLTWYCPCYKCCNRWSNGRFANNEKVKVGGCANDRYRFGTTIEFERVVPGTGKTRLVVKDRFGDGKPSYRIDVFVRSHKLATKLGHQKIRGRIVK